jgi:hypothetical protein
MTIPQGFRKKMVKINQPLIRIEAKAGKPNADCSPGAFCLDGHGMDLVNIV